MSDDGVVLVEHEDAPPTTTTTTTVAYNIVSIGTAEDAYAFHFHADKLEEIMNRVPPAAKIAVVSVVGAFRTGKSFLLSWFLRYLHAAHTPITSEEEEEEENNNKRWYETLDSLGNEAFHWKAGSERDTTGIWMWSHPVMLEQRGEKLAVLLVDTQGMFDHETTMSLTASIFGFSTLLSSYQVYNVDKRIQEDDLQQLALFSEYAKIAVQADEEPKLVTETSTVDDKETSKSDDKETNKGDDDKPKPFQRMEFLIRDWEHFDDADEEDDEASPNLEAMEQQMTDYLQKVIAERDAKDLKETREQIIRCFQEITCYGLCHPGFVVTKKKFTGSVADMEPLFLKLLDRFCNRVFGSLEAKTIHGRTLTAPQFLSYVTAYAQLFASGAKFPTAATLLEATASANNTNAIQMALAAYKEEMDRVAGPNCTNWLPPDELTQEQDELVARGLQVFESVANFGNATAIEAARQQLVSQLKAQFEVYHSLNQGRNPLAGFETCVFFICVFSELSTTGSLFATVLSHQLSLLPCHAVTWSRHRLLPLPSCCVGSPI